LRQAAASRQAVNVGHDRCPAFIALAFFARRVSPILGLVGRVDSFTAFAFRAAEARGRGDSVHEAKFDVPAPAARTAEEVHVLGPVLDDCVEVI